MVPSSFHALWWQRKERRFLFMRLSDGRLGRTYKYPGLILTCPESDRALFPFLPFRYGDMRRQIGFEIRDMWYNLGESPRSRPSGDGLPSEVGGGVGPVRQRWGIYKCPRLLLLGEKLLFVARTLFRK